MDSPDRMADLLASASAETEVSVDLEADSLHHFQDRVCLIQVSTSDCDWVVDPQASCAIDGLWRLLEDKRIVKVFHDADFDLRSLNRDFSLKVRNIFDTKVAAELLGWDKLGLAANLDRYFNVVLSKKFQRYNWSRRPISEDALQYAAMDTRFLRSFKEICLGELERLQRMEWARQEFQYLESFRWKPSKKERLQFWSLSGVRRMSVQRQEAVRLLWNIRKNEAKRLDLPVFRIFSDQNLLLVVNAFFEDANSRRVVQSHVPKRLQEKVTKAFKASSDVPVDYVLEKPPELLEGKPDYDKAVFENLRQHRDKNADIHVIDPGIIAGVRTLKKLAGMSLDQLANYCEVKDETGIRPWQYMMLGL